MSSQSREDDEIIVSLEDPEGQAPCPTASNKIGELSTKNKWENKLRSASFWNKMLVFSCVIAVSLDPLFFYIPIIDEDNKCLGMDKKLRNVTLILRSLTDTTFLVHIGYQIWEALNNKAYEEFNKQKSRCQFIIWQPFAAIFAGKLSWGSLLIDLLSVFPMPQLLVLKVFYGMKGKGYLERRKVVNFFLISQYLPRIYRIILSSKKLTRTTGLWVRALFNLCLYILASHVLGAFWYFFSIQRETSCWYRACQKEIDHEGCMSTFYCDDRKTSKEVIAFFNKSCSIDVPDGTTGPFQFGIFLDSLKTGNTGHINFPTKLAYSFWWGLRNLSNFGTNLITSSYVWENLFAVLISVSGLLLFLYLIGNAQIFMQITSEDIRQEEIRRLEKKRQKTKLKCQAWMEKKDIPDDMKKEIVKNINEKLEEDKDADVENLFNVLPWYTKKSLKRVLCLNILSQVQCLKEMDDKVLKTMCDFLRPVTYPKDKIIFESGHQINRMLLIIEGTLLTDSTTPDSSLAHGGETTKDSGSPATKKVKKGEVYGEELLNLALLDVNRLENLPTCPENVRCHTKVEGFTLSAEDLFYSPLLEEHSVNQRPNGSVYRQMKKRRSKNRKRTYFERNCGVLLEKKMSAMGETARIFTEFEVTEATNNYDVQNKVGEGRYAIVYKGVLDKQLVAIKRSKVCAQIEQKQSTVLTAQEQSVNEMTVLYQINHKNVVRLVGCCFETPTLIMVYELINNGTLYEYIHGTEGEKPPSRGLKERLEIAAETAGALAYLHLDTFMPVIHGDVKTANILLHKKDKTDEKLTPKLSDFKASILVSNDENQGSSLVHGTEGYVDPESKSKSLTEKSDVYSFGVVLAELLTSQMAISPEKPEAERELASVFVSKVEEGRLDEILDQEIVKGHSETVTKAADLAKRCLSLRREERPSMREVSAELQGLVRTMEQHPSGGEAKDTGILVASSASAVDITTSAECESSMQITPL